MSTRSSYLSKREKRGKRKKSSYKKKKKSSSFTKKSCNRPLTDQGLEKRTAKSSKHDKRERSLRYRIRRKTFANKKGERLSEAEWLRHERKTQKEQKEFLEVYSKKFKDVPVSSRKKNVRRGDHIFHQGSSGGLYNHHLLCTGVDEDGISLIEYSGNGFGVSSSSRSAAASNVLAFATVKADKLTYQELEDKKAKIRKWPQELERFDVNKVIFRAFSRINEREYHAFNNNCEHFVTWCKCGLNTSLQVKPWYKSVWHTVKGLGYAVISQSIPSSFRVAGMVLDELPEVIFSAVSPMGLVVGTVIELGFAFYSVGKDYKRINEKRLSKKQFKVNLVVTGSKAAGRIGGSIVGSVIGSAFGPVGSVVGGLLGCCVGHTVGLAVELCIENELKIKKTIQDYVVSPVKKMVNTVKAACRTIGKGIKRIVKRLVRR